MGDDKNSKGFSGLSSLASDIGQTGGESRRRTVQGEQPSAAGPSKDKPQPQRRASTPKPRPASQPEPESVASGKSFTIPCGSSWPGWFLGPIVGLGIFAGMWWAVANLEIEPGPSKVSSDPQPSSSSNYSPSLGSETRTSRLEFSKPPEGDDNALSVAQIRWCLREEIRIEVLRPMASTNSQIDQFNTVVADYNRRCASFRYREGTLMRARRELERVKPQIVANTTPPWK